MFKIITKGLDKLLNKSNEITLLGYYGRNNFGDDLMLLSIINELRSYNLKVNVLAFDDIPWLDKSVNVVLWGNTKKKKYLAFKQLATKDSLILFGGGTCFTDEDGDGFFKYMLFAKLNKIKIGYLGVGIGNLKRKSRRIKAKLLINMSDYLSFRDEHSFQVARMWRKFQKYNIELVEDPANRLLEVLAKPKRDTQNKGLVIAWRNLERYSQTTIGNNVSKVVEFALYLCEKYKINQIYIINADSYFDGEISKKVYESLKTNLGLKTFYLESVSYKDKLTILENSKVILTSRLHIAIAAEFLNKTCYVYNYSPKIQFFSNKTTNGNIIPFSNFYF